MPQVKSTAEIFDQKSNLTYLDRWAGWERGAATWTNHRQPEHRTGSRWGRRRRRGDGSSGGQRRVQAKRYLPSQHLWPRAPLPRQSPASGGRGRRAEIRRRTRRRWGIDGGDRPTWRTRGTSLSHGRSRRGLRGWRARVRRGSRWVWRRGWRRGRRFSLSRVRNTPFLESDRGNQTRV